MVDGRLIGGPILKIAKPDKAHIAEFWWVTNFLRLSVGHQFFETER